MFIDNLNRIIKELKKSKKISQADIAERIGMSASGFTDWLKGRGSPSPDTITKLAEILGVKVTDLVDEPQPTENTNISNNTFTNSVAVNNGSITINGYQKKVSELDQKLIALSDEEKKLALMFIDFLHSSGYELKKRE